MGYDQLTKGRHSVPHHVYFVTTTTSRREPIFSDFRFARALVFEMRRLHDAGHLESLAWVLMPDHLHWLFQLGAKLSLTQVMQRLKGRSAQAINRMRGVHGELWQPGYYEHALRSEEDLVDTSRYIVANPLRAGLVQRLADYPHWDAKWV